MPATASTAATPLDVCITVDMEPDCPPFLWTWRGMGEGAPKLLDLFARHGVSTTCFTTGDSAAKFPDVAARIVADGHELASHGQTHTPFPKLDRDKARWEIETSANILRQFGDVTSFRAPNLLFPHEYLGLLEDNGFTLDSSDGKHKPNWWFGPPSPQTTLTRIPASCTSSALRIPRVVRDRFLNSLVSPVVLFVHPWEFVDLTREKLRYDCRFRTGDFALSALESVIELFKARGARFLTVASAPLHSSGDCPDARKHACPDRLPTLRRRANLLFFKRAVGALRRRQGALQHHQRMRGPPRGRGPRSDHRRARRRYG